MNKDFLTHVQAEFRPSLTRLFLVWEEQSYLNVQYKSFLCGFNANEQLNYPGAKAIIGK